MKFVDKEIQEDFDCFSRQRKQKFAIDWFERNQWREDNARGPKIMLVKEWLEKKRRLEVLDSYRKADESFQSNELFPPIPPSHGIQFEIIDGKITSTVVKLGRNLSSIKKE